MVVGQCVAFGRVGTQAAASGRRGTASPSPGATPLSCRDRGAWGAEVVALEDGPDPVRLT
jgi:hypothetical protein